MKRDIVEELRKIVGAGQLVYEAAEVADYLYDETEPGLRPEANQECVVTKPGSVEEVSAIMKLANETGTVVVARGGGTGLCGAAVPVRPSIILSMERFKNVVEYDAKNFMITLECGVTLKELNDYLEEKELLYFPCHSGDENAQVGGMAAENAGGARAGKHGVMRNNIKGLEVVLPSGEVMALGGKLYKNNAGYDLLQLMIGSEGTLGVITKVMLRLYPEPQFNGAILVSFDSCDQATEAATRVLQVGIVPLAIEYLDRSIACRSAENLGEEWPLKNGSVDLLFMLAEESEDSLFNSSGIIEEICSNKGSVESLILDGKDQQDRVMRIRNNTYLATKPYMVDTLDIAVPPADMPKLMKGFTNIAEKFGATIDSVGHIGDGNVHNNIYMVDGKIPPYYEEMKEELYKLAVEMGGTITGEHGVGKTRIKNLPLQLTETQIALMRGIKTLFDPNNILNPDTAIY